MTFYIVTFAFLLTAICVWILLDCEFATVPSYVRTIFQPFNRGTQFGTYGTRAIGFALAVLALFFFGARIVAQSSNPVILITVVAIAMLALFAWVPLAAHFQRRTFLKSLVIAIEQHVDLTQFGSATQGAKRIDDWSTDGWIAWDISSLGSMTPMDMAYATPDGSSVMFPVHWDDFLCWNVPQSVSERSELPVIGPHNSRFAIESSRKLPSRSEWSLLRCRICSSDWDDILKDAEP